MFAEHTEVWNINHISFICFCLCEADYVIFINNINKLRISELRRKTANINGNNPRIRSVRRCERVTVGGFVFSVYISARLLSLVSLTARGRKTVFWSVGAARCGLARSICGFRVSALC